MEKTTTELEIKVSGGIEFTEDVLVLVEASKLSMDDEFMQYQPKHVRERVFKIMLSKAIKSGRLKDFYRPKYDPSFNEDHTEIYYKPGETPAVGKSLDWWKAFAETFSANSSEWKVICPPKSYYIAFLGILIKALVASGWTITEAWHDICIDSYNLGEFWNSRYCKNKPSLTGSKETVGFCDLGNTFKMLVEDDGDESHGFWSAGCSYYCYSCQTTLSEICFISSCDVNFKNHVPWFIFEKKNGN